MKRVRLAFFQKNVSDPDTGRIDKLLVKHKFNFVRYGSDSDAYIEPVNASDWNEVGDADRTIRHNDGEVFVEGIEVANAPEATGFDDPRGV